MIRFLLAIMVLASPAWAQPKPAAPAPERQVLLRHNSQSVLREVYLWDQAAPQQSGDRQGPDRLGTDVVRPGATHPLRLGAGPCEMALRVVFDDGGVESRALVNVCTEREIILDDRNTRAVEVVNNTDVELMQLFLSRPMPWGVIAWVPRQCRATTASPSVSAAKRSAPSISAPSFVVIVRKPGRT